MGWLLDSQRLKVKLPFHKAVAWLNQMDKILSKKSIGLKEIKSILGKLESITTIMKMFGNFLNNIRSLQIKANKLKNHNVKLICRAKDDLVLAKKFIKRASNGISMNMLTFRRPKMFMQLIHVNTVWEVRLLWERLELCHPRKIKKLSPHKSSRVSLQHSSNLDQHIRK